MCVCVCLRSSSYILPFECAFTRGRYPILTDDETHLHLERETHVHMRAHTHATGAASSTGCCTWHVGTCWSDPTVSGAAAGEVKWADRCWREDDARWTAASVLMGT